MTDIRENEIEIDLSVKQISAYDLLTDFVTSEIVFGGGARGGKSYLGSFWIISECLAKAGSAWLIAREELKALKRTTMRTLFKVMRNQFGLIRDVHYSFNAQDMVLTFINGSVVFFSELKRIPSDPEFDRIGSYDLTGAWIDEAQEVCKDAKDALQFRFTVMEGEGWTAFPKTLYTCNPSKGWIYRDFWKPLVKEKKKIARLAFITSLYLDNPWIDHEKYKTNVLATKNKIKIKRLLYGDFEYDDDDSRWIEYDSILDMFTNPIKPSDDLYLICDAARKGKDRAVIQFWRGMICKKTWTWKKNTMPQLEKALVRLSEKLGVPRSHILIDEDGIGGGVVDHVEGSKGFVNNSSCIQPEIAEDEKDKKLNYANLKTQCYYELANAINNSKIRVEGLTEEDKERLIEELEVVKERNSDNDKKIEMITKDKIKELLGRSPDLADTLMMRMYFELNKLTPIKGFII